MRIYAPAKLNICLDILKKTPGGYHEIRTVFVESPTLQDELEIKISEKNDFVSIQKGLCEICQNCTPKMEENLAYKAIKLLKREFQIKENVEIIITKNIPLSSGLGGASSDAAATLKALNKLWNLKLSSADLIKFAKELGMDVPFFIIGKTAIGTHYGEILESLAEITGIKFEILSQKFWPSLPLGINENKKTTQMYDSLDLSRCGKNTQETEKLIQGIKTNNSKLILDNIHNDFKYLYDFSKITSKGNLHLSGSGPAIFKTRLDRLAPVQE